MLKGQKRKNSLFLNQSIENQKLYDISKNQHPTSIGREDMRIYPLFDFEKVLFLPYLPFKLNWEVEIWYIRSLENLGVVFEGV